MASSPYRVPAVYRECVTDHQACGRAAKPQHGTCNLLGAAKPTDGHVFQHRVKGVGLGFHHLVEHRGMDDAWADGIDPNAPCGIVECSAFGQPKHSVLGGLICSALGTAHQPSDRRAVDDSATSLLEHLAQLELHATPHAAEIDGHHAVKVFPGSISSLCDNILNAGIVVGCIEPSKGSARPLDPRFHLSVIS